MHLIEATNDTVIKAYNISDHKSLPEALKFNFKPGDTPLLVKWYKAVDETSHYEFELIAPFKGRYNWFAFNGHMSITAASDYVLKATEPTVIKRYPIDSVHLSKDEKFSLNSNDPTLDIRWAKDVGDGTHYEFELKSPYNGVFNWCAFKEHVDTNAPILPYTPLSSDFEV